jgi:hypothetical protein
MQTCPVAATADAADFALDDSWVLEETEMWVNSR